MGKSFFPLSAAVIYLLLSQNGIPIAHAQEPFYKGKTVRRNCGIRVEFRL